MKYPAKDDVYGCLPKQGFRMVLKLSENNDFKYRNGPCVQQKEENGISRISIIRCQPNGISLRFYETLGSQENVYNSKEAHLSAGSKCCSFTPEFEIGTVKPGKNQQHLKLNFVSNSTTDMAKLNTTSKNNHSKKRLAQVYPTITILF